MTEQAAGTNRVHYACIFGHTAVLDYPEGEIPKRSIDCWSFSEVQPINRPRITPDNSLTATFANTTVRYKPGDYQIAGDGSVYVRCISPMTLYDPGADDVSSRVGGRCPRCQLIHPDRQPCSDARAGKLHVGSTLEGRL